MRILKHILCFITVVVLMGSCKKSQHKESTPEQLKRKELTAKDILGNPDYLAISYGGYRANTRDVQPTIFELKEDMKILAAMNVKIVRTYNVHLKQSSNLLKAISQLQKEDPNFEMYVMLGVWIDCKNAWTEAPNHDEESERNSIEIETAISLTKKYPEIVKIVAVGNEAMVKWATAYYVQPGVILKWVTYLQDIKRDGQLPKSVLITSSDNFASWGGGGDEYHVEDLKKLINAVDFVSMHTYPMHDTHYNPSFWGLSENEESLTKIEQIDAAMLRAKEYAISQYDSVLNYMRILGIDKPIHIGETGWASFSNGHFGNTGSKATDEYKEAIYYKHMRTWTNKNKISCFYFEAFDENWKDAENAGGSENHFGLFTINGKAKYALWKLVDQGIFTGLKRGGNVIAKTYQGDEQALLKEVTPPHFNKELITNN